MGIEYRKVRRGKEKFKHLLKLATSDDRNGTITAVAGFDRNAVILEKTSSTSWSIIRTIPLPCGQLSGMNPTLSRDASLLFFACRDLKVVMCSRVANASVYVKDAEILALPGDDFGQNVAVSSDSLLINSPMADRVRVVLSCFFLECVDSFVQGGRLFRRLKWQRRYL